MLYEVITPHCPYDPPQKYLDEIDEDILPDTIPGTKDSDKFRDYFIMANKLPWNGVDYTDFEESHKKKLKKHYCVDAALCRHHDLTSSAIFRISFAERFERMLS